MWCGGREGGSGGWLDEAEGADQLGLYHVHDVDDGDVGVHGEGGGLARQHEDLHRTDGRRVTVTAYVGHVSRRARFEAGHRTAVELGCSARVRGLDVGGGLRGERSG